MNSQTSRKIIVGSAMAAVVSIGVVTFALRSHPVASVAQTPHPPAPVAQTPAAAPAAAEIPAAPPAIAQIPDVPAAVAQIPDIPAVIAHSDSVVTKSADTATPSVVERKLARNQRLAKADTSTVATNDTVTRTGSAVDASKKPAAETVANSADRVKSADELTTTPGTSSSPADDQKAGTSTGFAASDDQIAPK
jgi:hypothetical protein